MANDTDTTLEAQLRTVLGLLDAAEQAYALARQLNQQLWQMRTWEQTSPLTPVGYSLGICLGDVEIAATRLGGLRHELQQLASALQRQSRD